MFSLSRVRISKKKKNNVREPSINVLAIKYSGVLLIKSRFSLRCIICCIGYGVKSLSKLQKGFVGYV